MDFSLNEDQRAIQDMARAFTRDNVIPNAAEWDEGHIWPHELASVVGELGFGSIYVSEESGGCGLSRVESVLIFEAIAYGCPAFSAMFSIHNMASWMIDCFGSETLKAKYLPDLVSIGKMASYCLTESGSGSDAAALKTRAVKDGDSYVLNGSKAFISGAGDSDIYVVMARTGGEGPKGISCFVVEKGMEGLSFGAREKKMGWHCQRTAAVMFDDCRVPAENMVGAEGDGFKIAMQGLDGGRLNIGACSIGGAQRALDEAIAYTKDRKQFGKAVSDFQNTQFALADLKTELEAARLLLYAGAQKVSDKAADAGAASAMAKRFSTDTGFSVANRALQMFGGYGYLKDYPVEKIVRDLRVHQILEGTNEIMRLVISRDMLRD